jgi:hypothetical protein
MQTDTWLTGTPYPERCPLCSQPLPGNSNICPKCGFTAHEPVRPASSALPQTSASRLLRQPNPITPIPARASAQRAQSSPGALSRRVPNPDASGASLSVTPEQQFEGWQHDSPGYEAASSLSSLSLIIAETPTAPPRATQRLAPPGGRPYHIDEIDTLPPPAFSRQQEAHLPVQSVVPGSLSLRLDDIEVPELAWLSSDTLVPYIDEIDTVPERDSSVSLALVPVVPDVHAVAVDATSWTAGPTTTARAQFVAARSDQGKRRHPRHFHLLDRLRWWLLRPGHIEFSLWLVGSILLFGITFLLLLATVLSMMLPGLSGRGNSLNSTVNGTGHQASISITATVAITRKVSVTPTVTANKPVPQSTPAAPVYPTPTSMPATPTSVSSTSTPVSETPTAGPTSTPAPSPTESTSTPTVIASTTPNSEPAGSSNLGNDENTTGNDSLFARLMHLNPLIWLIVACYFFSMIFLSAAGILRRRRR